MGIFVGWVVRGSWFFIVGFLVIILAVAIPWPRTIRLAVVFLGLAIIVAQLAMMFRDAFRARSDVCMVLDRVALVSIPANAGLATVLDEFGSAVGDATFVNFLPAENTESRADRVGKVRKACDVRTV